MVEAIFLSFVIVLIMWVMMEWINVKLNNWGASLTLSIFILIGFVGLILVIYKLLGGA